MVYSEGNKFGFTKMGFILKIKTMVIDNYYYLYFFLFFFFFAIITIYFVLYGLTVPERLSPTSFIIFLFIITPSTLAFLLRKLIYKHKMNTKAGDSKFIFLRNQIIITVLSPIISFSIFFIPLWIYNSYRNIHNLELQYKETINKSYSREEPVNCDSCLVSIEREKEICKNYIIEEKNKWPQCVPTYFVEKYEEMREFYSIRINDGHWVSLWSNKVGIRFDYPIDTNRIVVFQFSEYPKRDYDPSGIDFEWYTISGDSEDEEIKSNIAHGISNDAKFGRMDPFIYKWVERNGKYYINGIGGYEYEVEKILVRDTSFGTQALIFKTPCIFNCDNPEWRKNAGYDALIVNLPYNHREGLESIIFTLPQDISDSDLIRLIDSIKII